MRSERLFEIVFILLNRKQITAQELAKKFGVSVRTIYRDLDILSTAGIPVYTMQGTGGGIFIDESYTINKSILTKEDQEKILLALQCISPIDEMHIESILNRLSAIFQKNADWIRVDYSRWENKHDYYLFETLKQAILERRAVKLEYLSSYGEKIKRKVYPLRLLYMPRPTTKKDLIFASYKFINRRLYQQSRIDVLLPFRSPCEKRHIIKRCL